ncbi:hypothetical protein [Tunicatimonas pelagia]|uniref:hypothetical protein n=1 Tax=Tunicatimonas pelagia TaxID=931531 RepID=UPI002666C578|nr:hypothetical protein [Tunicatimonas pelagia]WKN42803.1 hypothetical protein P0M28_27585 [Tunicatimonas pelagia]
MSKVRIYVSRDPNTGELHLRDSEGHEGNGSIVTEVHHGDEVEWVLGEGIDEITGICPASGSQNIFQGEVRKNGNGNWKGTVNECAEGSEEYVIEYVTEGKTARSSNPQLDVKPPR